MKTSVFLRIFALAALSLMTSWAQTADFRALIESSSATVAVNSTVTFQVFVRNETIFPLDRAQLITTFPTSAQIVSYSNNLVNTLPTSNPITTGAGRVTFQADILGVGQEARFTLQLRPTQSGTLTLQATAQASGVRTYTTNASITVIAGAVDLAAGLSGFPPAILAGDIFQYQVAVTNNGPAQATSVDVTTLLPSGMSLVSISPAVASSLVNSQLKWTVGSLNDDEVRTYAVTLQSGTNVIADAAFSATVSAPTATNPDSIETNNVASGVFQILPLISTNLEIVNISTQVFNPLTSLMDQTVTVRNIGATNIGSVRAIATDLASGNKLYNAAGTNSGRPFAVVPVSLDPGQSVSIPLHFFFPSRTPTPVSLLAVEAPRLTAPATGPAMALTPTYATNAQMQRTLTGARLSFPTTQGKLFSLWSADNVLLTNLVMLVSPRFAQANSYTYEAQITETNRFFRVIGQ